MFSTLWNNIRPDTQISVKNLLNESLEIHINKASDRPMLVV